MKSVIFDMDGVLVNSNAAHFEAFQKMGEIVGVPFTQALLERTVGMHNNSIFPLWLGGELSPERVTELALQKESLYRQIASKYLDGIDGSVELVRSLFKSKFSLAVGSSGPRANVELALKTLEIGSYFSAVVTGDDVRHGKPAPDIFLQAAQKLQASTSDCLVIEDAPQGVQAALAAGMKVIAVTTSMPRDALSEAHLVVDSLRDLNPESILRVLGF